MSAILSGIDEAGRGPVIGPLVLACVSLDAEGVETLRDLGVRDSKKMTALRRRKLEPEIKNISLEWSIAKISASDIDRLRKRMSLNVIEAVKTAELIIALKKRPTTIYIDATDSIAEDYQKKIVAHLNKLNPAYEIPQLVCEHKADDTYIPTSAASVIAKVERDRDIEALQRVYGDIGSGYPSGELTQKFIRRLLKDGPLPPFVRRSWETVNKSKQSSLSDF